MPIVGDAKKVLSSEAWELGVGKRAAAILGGQTPRHGKLSVKELAKGIKEEGEHTPNLEARKEISIDHLAENPKYYTESEKLEKAAMAGGKLPNTSMSTSNTASSTPNVSRLPAPGAVAIQKNQGPGDLAVGTQHRSKTIIPAGGGQASGAQGSTPGIGSGGVAQAQPMTSTASGQPGSPPTQSTGASYGMGPSLPKTAVELRRLGAYAIRYLGGI